MHNTKNNKTFKKIMNELLNKEKKYLSKIINQFKNRGALSTCVDMPDYNVFHK